MVETTAAEKVGSTAGMLVDWRGVHLVAEKGETKVDTRVVWKAAY